MRLAIGVGGKGTIAALGLDDARQRVELGPRVARRRPARRRELVHRDTESDHDDENEDRDHDDLPLPACRGLQRPNRREFPAFVLGRAWTAPGRPVGTHHYDPAMAATDPSAPAVRTLLDGLRFGEGPRWHDGRVWFSDMHDHRVVSVDLDGDARTEARIDDDEPSGLGWLPDGRLLVVAMESQQLRCVGTDGVVAVHADLSSAATGSLNDMIVTADGTAYIGDMGTRIHEAGEMRPGRTFCVRPDGSWFVAAEDLLSPNGHVLTPDERTLLVAESGGGRVTAFDRSEDGTLSNRRVYAELSPAPDGPAFAPPDGICLDAEGAVWVADPIGARVFRALPDGTTTREHRFAGLIPVACVLAGPDRTTLVVCAAADWKRDVVMAARTGCLLALDVDVSGVGRP